MATRAWAYMLYALSRRGASLEAFLDKAVQPALMISIHPCYSEGMAAPGALPVEAQVHPCVGWVSVCVRVREGERVCV